MNRFYVSVMKTQMTLYNLSKFLFAVILSKKTCGTPEETNRPPFTFISCLNLRENQFFTLLFFLIQFFRKQTFFDQSLKA